LLVAGLATAHRKILSICFVGKYPSHLPSAEASQKRELEIPKNAFKMVSAVPGESIDEDLAAIAEQHCIIRDQAK
jgi:hypothetical protein